MFHPHFGWVAAVAVLATIVWIPSVQGDTASDAAGSVAGYQASCVGQFFNGGTGSTRLLTLRTGLNCLKSVQMDAQKAVAIAHAMQASYELYSLRSAAPSARDAIYSLASNILDTSVSPPVWKRFVSEHEYLQRAAQAMLLARDPHFVLVTPSIYLQSIILRPYNLASRYNKTTGKQELYIAAWSEWWPSILSRIREDSTGIGVPGTWNVEAFITAVDRAITSGAAIATMNNLDPIAEWFPSIEASYGHADKGANFNYGLLHNFVWGLTYSPPQLSGFTHQGQTYCNASTVLCDRDDLYDRLVMSDGKSIVGLKWLLLYGGLDYPQSCAVFDAAGRVPENLQLAKSMLPPLPLKNPRRLPEQTPNHTLSRRVQGPDTTVQKARMLRSALNDTLRTYMSNKKDLAVLEINSFFPDGFTFDTILELSDALSELVSLSAEAGTNKLLIDVTGNGGGYILLMDLTVKLLFPKRFYVEYVADSNDDVTYPNFTTVNFPGFSTSVNAKMMSASAAAGGDSTLYGEFGPLWFGSLLNETFRGVDLYPIVTAADLLKGTANPWWTQLKSGTGSYPTPYFYSPSAVSFGWDWNTFQSDANNPFTKVKILSNGQCGSACAMFVSRISTFVPDTEVITYGGWKDSRNPAMETTQFCGGTVYRMSCISGSPSIKYNFFGLESNIGKSSYYPLDVTTNVQHFYTDTTKSVVTNTPRQLESVVGDQHWWMWEPTFDEKVAELYPDIEFSAARGVGSTLPWISLALLALRLLAQM